MQKSLIFVGSRNLMRQLALIAELNEIEIVGILDHHYWGNTEFIGDIPVIGDERWLLDPNNIQAQTWLQNCNFFPANWWHGNQPTDKNNINMQELRNQRINILKQSGANVINLIHPTSLPPVSKYADFKIGQGVFIDAECWFSIDQVVIGDFCGIEVGSRISHNTTLGENVLVAPEVFLCDCNVGSNSFIGTRSCTSSRRLLTINIGENSTVWAGAEVIKNIPDNSIYTNNNRILKKFNV
jgi:acetyltransferase-like isoleucine patch superfamily enzyme